MLMQYAAIFDGSENDIFKIKKNIFLFLLKTKKPTWHIEEVL